MSIKRQRASAATDQRPSTKRPRRDVGGRRGRGGDECKWPPVAQDAPHAPVMLGVLLAGSACALNGDGQDGSKTLRRLSDSFAAVWKASMCFEETEVWEQDEALLHERSRRGVFHSIGARGNPHADRSAAASTLGGMKAPALDEEIDVAVFFSVLGSVAASFRTTRGDSTGLRLLTPASDAVAVIDTRAASSSLEYIRDAFFAVLLGAADLSPAFFPLASESDLIVGGERMRSPAGWWHHGAWRDSEVAAWREEEQISRGLKGRRDLQDHRHRLEPPRQGLIEAPEPRPLPELCSIREAVQGEPHARCLAAAYISFYNGRADVAARATASGGPLPLCDWVLAISLRVAQAVVRHGDPRAAMPSAEELAAQTLSLAGTGAADRLRGAQTQLFLLQEAKSLEVASCMWRQDLAFEDRLPALLCLEDHAMSAGRSTGAGARSRFRTASSGRGNARAQEASPMIGLRKVSPSQESIVVSNLRFRAGEGRTSRGGEGQGGFQEFGVGLLDVIAQGDTRTPAAFFGPGDCQADPRGLRSDVRVWRVVAVDLDRSRVVAMHWRSPMRDERGDGHEHGGASSAEPQRVSATVFYARGGSSSVRRKRLALPHPTRESSSADVLESALCAANSADRLDEARWALFRFSLDDSGRTPSVRSI